VAVLDIRRAGRTRREGLIPTERYPSAVAVSPDGKRLLIGTAKGFYGPNAGSAVKLEGAQVRGEDEGAGFKYIAQMLSGRLAIVEVPGKVALANFTKQVYENNPIGIAALNEARDRKRIEKEAFAKIKHVIYVIRENRTYDQVLGDLKPGNGDPSLAVFGEALRLLGAEIPGLRPVVALAGPVAGAVRAGTANWPVPPILVQETAEKHDAYAAAAAAFVMALMRAEIYRRRALAAANRKVQTA
jgi:hypothetical protein